MKHISSNRGVSLIEGVLYLVIALAVIVGGIVFFQKADLSRKVTDTSRMVGSLSTQTRALYRDQKLFEQRQLGPVLISSDIVPAGFVGGDGVTEDVIEHPWDGEIEVFGDSAYFDITLRDVPRAPCVRLATVEDTGVSRLGTAIAGIAVNDTTELYPDFPLTPSEAEAYCTSGDDNMLRISFHKDAAVRGSDTRAGGGGDDSGSGGGNSDDEITALYEALGSPPQALCREYSAEIICRGTVTGGPAAELREACGEQTRELENDGYARHQYQQCAEPIWDAWEAEAETASQEQLNACGQPPSRSDSGAYSSWKMCSFSETVLNEPSYDEMPSQSEISTTCGDRPAGEEYDALAQHYACTTREFGAYHVYNNAETPLWYENVEGVAECGPTPETGVYNAEYFAWIDCAEEKEQENSGLPPIIGGPL